jgi:hypothetical protein
MCSRVCSFYCDERRWESKMKNHEKRWESKIEWCREKTRINDWEYHRILSVKMLCFRQNFKTFDEHFLMIFTKDANHRTKLDQADVESFIRLIKILSSLIISVKRILIKREFWELNDKSLIKRVIFRSDDRLIKIFFVLAISDERILIN